MTDVIVLEYQVSDARHFISCYKSNLLPVVRTAVGFRHIQLARRGTDSVLILIEFAFVADYERFKKRAPPGIFPLPQDLRSEEVLGTLPNTSFPLANAREYQPSLSSKDRQGNARRTDPDHPPSARSGHVAAAQAVEERATVPRGADKPLRHTNRSLQRALLCPICREQPEIVVKALAPHYEAYRLCRCGNERIDHVVTIRWMYSIAANTEQATSQPPCRNQPPTLTCTDVPTGAPPNGGLASVVSCMLKQAKCRRGFLRK